MLLALYVNVKQDALHARSNAVGCVGSDWRPMFWLLMAASQMSLPTSVNPRVPDPRAVFSVNDFPGYLQLQGGSRIIPTRTTVDQSGKIESCVVERPSRDRFLDKHTCRIIVKRNKLAPARWMDGSAVYGVLRLPVGWYVTNDYPSENFGAKLVTPDLKIAVRALPKASNGFASIELAVAVDETGKPLQCAEYQPRRESKRKYSAVELAAAACGQIVRQLVLAPPTDPQGKPARSVQSAVVHFVEAKT